MTAPISRWVYRLSDGMILPRGGFYFPTHDEQGEGIIEFSDAEAHPDKRAFRVNVPTADNHNPAQLQKTLVPASQLEQAQFDAEDPPTLRKAARDRLIERKRRGDYRLSDLHDILTFIGIGN